MSDWLSHEDIITMTAAKRFTAQRKRLSEMGVPFLQAWNGRPLVQRDTIGYRARTPRKHTPNWEAIPHAAKTHK